MKTTARFLNCLVLATLMALITSSVSGAELVGLNVGEKAPDFALLNQDSKVVKLEDLRKRGPVALVFFRSADW